MSKMTPKEAAAADAGIARIQASLDADATIARLNALAAKWKAEADDAKPDANDPDSPQAAARRAAVRQKRICTRQLLDALGVPLLDAIAGAE